MTEEDFPEIRNDPDYKEFYRTNKNDPNSARAEDSKHIAVFKIEDTLKRQFSMEMEFKEQEIHKIQQRIDQTKVMLDRLRAYVAAGYYGSGGLLIPGSKVVEKEPKSKKIKSSCEVDLITTTSLLKTSENSKINDSPEESINKESDISLPQVDENQSRFYVSKKLIIGNVSKYLLADARKEDNQSTHKWMVYVRTESGDDSEIEKYIKMVLFFLHPSYIPNDIVTVTKPPFQVTRRGWGEFPVRVQLHFKDSINKRFDVIHNLKLDKTYTGLQTLGAETVVEIELNKHASGGNEISSKEYGSPTELANSVARQQIENVEGSEFDATNKEDTELRKLTLPIIADLKSKLPAVECASVASSCVNSPNPSRCNSPVADTPFNNTLPLGPEIDNLLYQLVPSAPLIANEAKRGKFFTCHSIELYQSWHFTKRRAYEWHRASYLRKLFMRNCIDEHGRCPTTKEVLIWLRHCGFTPPEKNLNVVMNDVLFCNLCGKYLEKDQNENIYCLVCKEKKNQLEPLAASISLFTSVLSNVKIKEETLLCIEKAGVIPEEEIMETDLDVMNTEKELHFNNNAFEVQTIMPTLAENWVTDTVQKLDISLKQFQLSNVKTPVVQAMLFSAMKSFMCHLLRKSNMESKLENKNTIEPALVTFRQVHTAVLKEPLFDFLTDAHLGKL